jgi:hypothetical protein
MKHLRGIGKHVMAGLFAATLVVGMVGTSFAAPAAPPTPNGTWTYKATTSLGTFNGTMAITQFKWNATTKCWLANIVKSKAGSYSVNGTVKICGTKLSATAKGNYSGIQFTGTASGTTNKTYTTMSAKFSAGGGLISGSLTATKK